MGVSLDVELVAYMVVIEVDSAVHKASTSQRLNHQETGDKYFKQYDKPEAVIKLVAELKPNEKARTIFSINDLGKVVPHIVEFKDGKLQLTNIEEELLK